MLKVARSTPGTWCTDLCCAWWDQRVLPMMVGVNGHSIQYLISDAIVCSWWWLIATRSCPLGYFSSITASSWDLTPQTVIVHSPLRDSCPNETLPFFYCNHDYKIYILVKFLLNMNILSFDVDSLITCWFKKCF